MSSNIIEIAIGLNVAALALSLGLLAGAHNLAALADPRVAFSNGFLILNVLGLIRATKGLLGWGLGPIALAVNSIALLVMTLTALRMGIPGGFAAWGFGLTYAAAAFSEVALVIRIARG